MFFNDVTLISIAFKNDLHISSPLKGQFTQIASPKFCKHQSFSLCYEIRNPIKRNQIKRKCVSYFLNSNESLRK